MDIELKVINGTDREIRFEVHMRGESKGELMVERSDFTRFADLIFGRDYKIIGNQTKLHGNNKNPT